MQISATGGVGSPYAFQQKRVGGHAGQFADLFSSSTARATDKAAVATPSGSSGIGYAGIEAEFDSWSRQRRTDGAGDDYMNGVDAARATYLDIARKAQGSDGLADPVAFVQSLDANELQALQTIHSLAEPIDPASLTKEGALNLLLPRTMARDIDGDGMMMVGVANTIAFPPGDAPQAVKDAWAKTTKGMDFGMKLNLQMSMHLAGNAVRADGGDEDYGTLVDRAVQGATFNLRYQRPDTMVFAKRMLDALKTLQANLSTNGV